jgi:hypothetical protein
MRRISPIASHASVDPVNASAPPDDVLRPAALGVVVPVPVVVAGGSSGVDGGSSGVDGGSSGMRGPSTD